MASQHAERQQDELLRAAAQLDRTEGGQEMSKTARKKALRKLVKAQRKTTLKDAHEQEYQDDLPVKGFLGGAAAGKAGRARCARMGLEAPPCRSGHRARGGAPVDV